MWTSLPARRKTITRLIEVSPRQGVIDILLQRNNRAAPITAIRGDDGDLRRNRRSDRECCPRLKPPKIDGVHRADARAGQHRDRGFGNHRHVNDDAVAFLDSVALQHVREPANLAMQLLISQGAFVARFTFPNDRRLVAVRAGEMAVEAILRDVEFPADKPLRERRFPFEHLLPRRLPDQLSRFARPELLRRLDRLAMHPPVMLEAADARFLREGAAGFEDAFLDQVRLDVFFHDG